MILILSMFTLLMPLAVQDIGPVTLDVLFDGLPEYGGEWTLGITLQAKEDLKEVEIWVEKTDGLKIKSGSPFWNGVLKSGQKEVITLFLKLIGPPPQEITVNLVGRTSGGHRFEKKVYRTIGFVSERVTEHSAPTGFKKRTSALAGIGRLIK